MALVSCYECEGKVSSLAEACPHCGAPHRTRNSLVVGRHFVYVSNGETVCKIRKDDGFTEWQVRIAAQS